MNILLNKVTIRGIVQQQTFLLLFYCLNDKGCIVYIWIYNVNALFFTNYRDWR
jgi:hypothetical protein